MRNLFSVIIICLSFLILGVFISLSNNLKSLAGDLAENLVAVLFLEAGIEPEARSALESEIRADPHVTDVRYVSPEEALATFREKFPELQDIVNEIGTNPFPSSLQVSLQEKVYDSAAVLSLLDSMKKKKGITDIQFNREWVEKTQSLGRLATAMGVFLGGILILASFFIVSNAVKLNVFSRKNEIEILRFVGATNTFIRIPFLLEGALLGALGGLLSLLFLLILIELFPLYLGSSLGALQEIIGFRYLTFLQSSGLVVGGASTGLLGSLSSLSRFLKI